MPDVKTESDPETGTASPLLKLADGELFTGHVLTSLAGWGPELEVNLALSSIGQDELGHARLYYTVVAGGTDRGAINDLIYERPPDAFAAGPLEARYPPDWETLVVKQYLYETADRQRLHLLHGSNRSELASICARMNREEDFHLDFWTTWFARTARGSREGYGRVQRALTELWPSAMEVLRFQGDDETAETALGLPSNSLEAARDEWTSDVVGTLEELDLSVPADVSDFTLPDDRDQILEEMRSVYGSAPGSW